MDRAELEQLLAPYPTLLTVDEVATVLRVHPRSIQRWAREGRVPSVRVGRSYRIARADVVRWVLDASSESGTTVAVSPPSATPLS